MKQSNSFSYPIIEDAWTVEQAYKTRFHNKPWSQNYKFVTSLTTQGKGPMQAVQPHNNQISIIETN